MAVQIFAVGGGGFTHPEDAIPGDSVLEDELLALVGPVESVRIGYIGHANDDNTERLRGFYDRFQKCAATDHLPLNADVASADKFLSRIDILYVSGGATVKLLAHWHKTGIASSLLKAAHHGVIMSGVSAGAICWFEDLLLGTAQDGYNLHSGLGLLPGSACPHYHNEPERKEAYDNHVSNRQLAAGLAIDDGVGVYIIDGVVKNIIRARGNTGNAYRVECNCDSVALSELQTGHKLI